mmetsp:Transcript_14516/g.32646  ORF Transcript_14516/g.32646 Transcript_14516/m.32646 type:complete len:146 (+) Transcript_14516:218-655(+)
MVRSSFDLIASMMLVVLSIVPEHSSTDAFLPRSGSISTVVPSSGRIWPSPPTNSNVGGVVMLMLDRNDDNKSRLRDLGYSDDEIERSTRTPPKEQRKVRVDMVDNVDAATLTAVGFGLIAFNFFVLANMGDGGIGGIVATIINSF